MLRKDEKCVIIKRHPIILLLIFLRFGLIFLFWFVSLYFVLKYIDNIPLQITEFLILPFAFIVVNYAFLKLILNLIEYNNNLVLFVRNKVILTKGTVFLVDDVEIIDIKKIMKVDVECRGILANFIGWGHLIIEQQKNDVRVIHFMPRPYEVLKFLEEKRDDVYNKKNQVQQIDELEQPEQ